MLSIEPSVFFVDDKLNEVKGIIDIYREKGYGVKYFNASAADGDAVPEPNTYHDASLIFLDLYYDGQRILDEEKCSEWVESIVRKDAFFILVIWSQDTDEAEVVLKEIGNNSRVPFVSIIKQKSDYQNGDGQWDFDKLNRDIETQLNSCSELKELASWKKSIKSSSNLIIGHLTRGEDSNILASKLKKIIKGHGGEYYVSEDNCCEKQEVLFDALDSVLISNSKNTRPKIEIEQVNQVGLYNTTNIASGEIDAKLNSWFHFKIQPTPISQNAIIPGIICKMESEEVIANFGIKDDSNVSKYLKPQIEMETKYLKQKNEDKSKNEDVKGGEQEEIINTGIEHICVLLTRPCDIAQNKFGKNLKLLSGLKITKPVRKGGNGKKKNDLKSDQKPDSIKLLDHLCFNDIDEVALVFDYRYMFSVSEQNFKDNFKNLAIFNKELLSEIQVEYASYSSRLGITQII